MARVPEPPQADIARRLVKILIGHLGVTEADIGPDVLLVPDHDGHGRKVPTDRADLGADSLDVVEIAMAAEDEFDVEMPDHEVTKLNRATFGELVDYIHSKREAANG